ncbi:MAG: hypothetical protein H6968_11635 [Chromatiaceae bacterium]|nr:hypothetical protein [Chromatiaceae bacterium]
MPNINRKRASQIFFLLLCTFELIAHGETQPITVEATLEPVWNDFQDSVIDGSWLNDSGVREICSFPNVNVDDVANEGYMYIEDFLNWAAFALKPEFLPAGIKEHVIPLKMGKMSALGGLPIERAIDGKDGLLVRYNNKDRIIQIADTRFDLRICIKEIGRNKQSYNDYEREAFGMRVLKDLLQSRFLYYPDGKQRLHKQEYNDTHVYIQWNWQSTSSQDDENSIARNNLALPFGSFVRARTDGRSAIIVFSKNYPVSSRVPVIVDMRSRFAPDARFRPQQ